MFFKVTERAIYGKIAGTELSEGKKSIVFPWKPNILSVSLILHILFLSRTPGNKTP